MPELISPDSAGIGRNEQFLLYGDPKVGKSHAALTVLGLGNAYLMSVGRSNESKTYYSAKFQDYIKKRGYKGELYMDVSHETFDFEDPTTAAVGFDNTKALIEEAYDQDAKGIISFNSVIIDNISITTDFQINKAIKLSDANRSGESQARTKSTLDKAKELGGVAPADFEWRDVQNMMAKFLSELFATPKNIIVIAHEWEQTVTNRSTKQSDVVAVKPRFVGQQRDTIAAMFDNVWRFYAQGQFYYARTVPQDKPFSIIAGSRIGGLVDAEYMNPDLTDTINKFKTHAEKIRAEKEAADKLRAAVVNP